MPRTVRKSTEPSPTPHPDLIARLVAEMGRTAGGGQPRVEEEHFPATGLIRAVVLWDEWDRVPDEDRVSVVRAAYAEADGPEVADRLALVSALTLPEADEFGMTPYRVVPLLRRGDPVTPEECAAAMVADGASVLADPTTPLLAFATAEEAEACVARLAAAVPASEPVWAVTRDAGRLRYAAD